MVFIGRFCIQIDKSGQTDRWTERDHWAIEKWSLLASGLYRQGVMLQIDPLATSNIFQTFVVYCVHVCMARSRICQSFVPGKVLINFPSFGSQVDLV